MARPSIHREPVGVVQIARHDIRDMVYGANDGIITTFAVVAGVTGGALSPRAVPIVGAANLFADGLSMGVGNHPASVRSTSAVLPKISPSEKRGQTRQARNRDVSVVLHRRRHPVGALPGPLVMA